MDPQIEKLAHILINHSCELQPGQKVLIEAIDAPADVVSTLISQAKAARATPLLLLKQHRLMSELCSVYSAADAQLFAECELELFKRVDAFVSIRAAHNPREFEDVPKDKLANMLRYYVQPVHYEYRNQHVRWVSLRWPGLAMAQTAGLSMSDLRDLFFRVCTIDYLRLESAMTPLSELMSNTDQVRIIGPADTDLSFSIRGMPNYRSAGRHNIPDGEVFTAPHRESSNGRIRFNLSSNYYGFTFEDVCLDLRDGKVIAASCNNSVRLNEILEQDEGARYLGEFAFGLHPGLEYPINDILFDEKIAGSLHVALGNAYPNCNNGNKSAIHWDLILNQNVGWGGGEVYFDGRLIRKDGRFVLPELDGLNRERLAELIGKGAFQCQRL